MDERVMETGAAPRVVVETQERLTIRGWDRREVHTAGPEGTVNVRMDGDAVHLAASGRLDVRVPQDASIEATGFGDVIVRDVMGSIHIRNAGDNLTLRDVGPVQVDTIHNDLTAREVHGDLTVGSVGRFANARSIHGDFRAEQVGAHVNVRAVEGDVVVDAGGNANVNIDLAETRLVHVKSGGVITCRTYPDLNAEVRIRNSGPITVKVGDVRESVQDSFEMTFGEGAGKLELEGQGPITLSTTSREGSSAPAFDFDFSIGEDLAGIGAGIGEQLREQLSMIEEELEARMSGFSELVENWELTSDQAEKINARTREKAEKVQEKIRRAQARAARKIAAARKRAEREAGRAERAGRDSLRRSYSFSLGSAGKGRREQTDPVTDEERLMILNMVAENKISLEEAEALLSALEGK